MHYAWTEIQNFTNLNKSLERYPHHLPESKKVVYKSKVKLHGENHAVTVNPDGTLTPQSRGRVLAVEDDNNGFAKFVKSNESFFAALKQDRTFTIFGELAGPGVKPGVAVSKIPNKIFAVFAIVYQDQSNSIITDPKQLSSFLFNDSSCKDVYVLPWYEDKSIEIDFSLSSTYLQSTIEIINNWVSDIEKCDPWVKETFNVEGTGEGLVFYPNDVTSYETFSNLTFKAKGEKHATVEKAKPVQVDPNVANSVNEFANMVLTEARLVQGADTVNGSTTYLKRNVGSFIKWITTDVFKETKAEMEASNLDSKLVEKSLIEVAKSWYLSKAV